MQLSLILIVITSLVLTQSTLIRRKRIVNGDHAIEGNHPYMVSFYRLDQLNYPEFDTLAPVPYCGGALVRVLNRSVILTAGHCLSNKFPTQVRITFDLYDLRTTMTSEVIERSYMPETFFLHPYYDDHQRNPRADIGLVLMKPDFDRSNQTALSVPDGDLNITDWKQLVVAGWGRLGKFREQPRRLQVLSGMSYDPTCNWLYGDSFLTNHVCLRDRNGTRYRWKDICNGDSGSPLVFENSTLIGVASWGTCMGIPASVFTRVDFYLSWIKENIQNYYLEDQSFR